MIPFETARDLIRQHCFRLSTESVALEKTDGRVLAVDIRARSPMPRFDSSAVDGYALSSVQTKHASHGVPVTLPVIATIRAGDAYRLRAGQQQALRIFTGAMLPPGTDSVIMQEHVRQEQGVILIDREVKPGENVRRKGEEFSRNDTVLKKGTRVTPPVHGLMAAMGLRSVRVTRMPRVSVIVTGSELRPSGERPGKGEIIDSNSPSIAAALAGCGIEPMSIHRVDDDPEALRAAMSAGLMNSDILITVGGVSVGDYDFVRDVSDTLGIREIFWTVAMKPGKPNFFGKKGKTLIFGLPGNPVAALLSFHFFVRTALSIMTGREQETETLFQAVLTREVRKKAGRCEFVRAALSNGPKGELLVSPHKAQHSHMLSGMTEANALIHFPADTICLPENQLVTVSLLQWTY
ncbi:MAG: molybdopterin molybdotransferase MoeA [Bacteroidetes bacterium]|nr:molybdopterin molybdotransferase MoeA [Bacteroidota bacterium]